MLPHFTDGDQGKGVAWLHSQQAHTRVEPPSEEGAEKEQVEVKTHGHSYRNVGEEAGRGKERAAGWPGEGGEGGGLPFDPRAPKMLSGQTRPENPSWIPPHSSLCGLVLQPCGAAGHCLWQPHSPALVSRPQRHLARLREARGGRGPPRPRPASQPLL